MPEHSRAVKAYRDTLGDAIVGEFAGPESLHPRYIEMRDARHACLTLQEGTKALRRDAAVSGHRGGGTWTDRKMPPAPDTRQFIWPSSDGEEKKRPGEYLSRYEDRVRRLRIDNVFKSSVTAISSKPFTTRPTVTGWAPFLVDLLEGKGTGIDGRGASLMAFYRPAFEAKLFAGIHFLRLEVFSATARVPALVHLFADDLLFWSWERVSGVPTLRSANIHLRDGERLTYNTVGESMLWAKWVWAKDADDWSINDFGVLPAGIEPIFPLYTDWRRPFESPPPFADAAEAMMEAVRATSEADALRKRIANSPLFVVSGWKSGVETKSDGTKSVKALPFQAGGLVFTEEAKTDYLQIDAQALPALRETIDEDLARVREMIQSARRREIPGDQVTATEISFYAGHEMTFLQAAVASDAASLRKAVSMMARAAGAITGSDGEITIPLSFDAEEKRAVLSALKPWYDARVVTDEVAVELIAQAYPELPDDIVKRMRRPTQPAPDPAGSAE